MALRASVLDTLAPPPTGSFRVRAPVTLDDDSSSSSSSSSDIEYNSDKDRNFSRKSGNASVNNTIGIGSGSVRSVEDESEYEEFESAFERPFLWYPDEDSPRESSFVGKDENFRPFVSDICDEIFEDSIVEEEESDVIGRFRSYRVELLGKDSMHGRPIAQLSMDDDDFDELVDDEGMGSEMDDGGVPPIVRVPSIGVLERVDVSPGTEVLCVEGDDEDDLLVQEDPSSVNKSELLSLRVLNDSLMLGNCSQGENDVVVASGSAEDSLSVQVVDAHCKALEEHKDVIAVKASALVEDSKHALDDFAASRLNDCEVHDTTLETHVGFLEEFADAVDNIRKLDVDESVETWGQQFQEFRVEVEGVRGYEPMNCDGIEVGNVVGGVLSRKFGDGETLEGESMLVTPETVSNTVGDKTEEGGEKTEVGGCESLQFDKNVIHGGSETTTHCTGEMQIMPVVSSLPEAESSNDHELSITRQIIMDMDGDEDEGKALSETATVKLLFEAAAGAQANGDSFSVTSSDVSKVDYPANSGSSLHNSKPASVSSMVGDVEMASFGIDEKKISKEIHHIRVKFLRLVQQLGHSVNDSIVAQVLHRLALATEGHASEDINLAFGNRMARELDANGKHELEFSLNVLVLGKTGVGKSATINSIFGEKKVSVNAFEPGTSRIKEIIGTVNGVRFKVLETPGLRSNVKEEAFNQKVLASIKKYVNKHPPDVVLYVDRLDVVSGGGVDLSLIRSLTNSLTPSIWQNAIIVLTHAASPLPDGPSGSPLPVEVLVAQQSHAIHLAISQATGDLRFMHPSMMCLVSLVENHPFSLKNDNGDILLPNGQNWRSQLLLLCYSLKILAEASSLRKPTDPFNHKKLFGFRPHSLSLPHLVSSLLQFRPHPKLTADQGSEDIDLDIESVDPSDSNEADENEYDQLPPFKPLTKSQLDKLSKNQRKAYFDEYDYRVKLFERKQWREEIKKLKEIKKKGKDYAAISGSSTEDIQEDEGPATVPVTMPDFVLPLSFDSNDPSYRYRSLGPTSQLLVRPVLDSQGWDHDCGLNGVNIESNLAIAGKCPSSFAVQIAKDKKDFNIHLDSSVSIEHGENRSSMAGFEIQTVGRQLAYVLRGETKFKNFKINKTSTGLSVTLLGENIAVGLKIEDQIAVGKQLALAGAGGIITAGDDAACGVNLEVRVKSKSFPIVQDQSSIGLSFMKWRGDLGVMASLQTQFSIGRNSTMAIRVGMNQRRNGQITIKTTTSDSHIVLVSLIPVVMSIFRNIYPGSRSRNLDVSDCH